MTRACLGVTPSTASQKSTVLGLDFTPWGMLKKVGRLPSDRPVMQVMDDPIDMGKYHAAQVMLVSFDY